MNVCVNVSSLPSPGEAKAPVVEVIVWVSSSWLTHVTVVPRATSSAAGANLNSLIPTSTDRPPNACAATATTAIPITTATCVLIASSSDVLTSDVLTPANAKEAQPFRGNDWPAHALRKTRGLHPGAIVDAWRAGDGRREYPGEPGLGLRRRPAQPGALSHRQRDGCRGSRAGDLRAGSPGRASVHSGHELEGLAVPDLAEHVPELVPATAQRPDGGRARHGRGGGGGRGARRLAPGRRRARPPAQGGRRGDRGRADDALGGRAHGDPAGSGRVGGRRGGRGPRRRGRDSEAEARAGPREPAIQAQGLRAVSDG